VALTAAGESFRTHAAQSMQGLEQAAELARRAGRGEEGRLTLRFSLMAGLTILPSTVARFQRTYPGVELRIEPGGSVAQLEAIRAGACDIGFMAFKPELAPLATELVQAAPLVALLPENHPLARRKRLALAALAGEKFVFLKNASEPELHLRFRRRCIDAGFEPNIVFEIEQVEVLLALVAAGVGVACAPGLVRMLTFPGIVLTPLQPEIQTGISAVWDPRRRSTAVQNFLTLLREERRARPDPWQRGRPPPR
jgi:DNA-binding transcriptional LysR family regulator